MIKKGNQMKEELVIQQQGPRKRSAEPQETGRQATTGQQETTGQHETTGQSLATGKECQVLV